MLGDSLLLKAEVPEWSKGLASVVEEGIVTTGDMVSVLNPGEI